MSVLVASCCAGVLGVLLKRVGKSHFSPRLTVLLPSEIELFIKYRQKYHEFEGMSCYLVKSS